MMTPVSPLTSIVMRRLSRRSMDMQIGVRQVIAGWDIGILGDEQNGIPPMKVPNTKQSNTSTSFQNATMQCVVPPVTMTRIGPCTRASGGASLPSSRCSAIVLVCAPDNTTVKRCILLSTCRRVASARCASLQRWGEVSIEPRMWCCPCLQAGPSVWHVGTTCQDRVTLARCMPGVPTNTKFQLWNGQPH